MYQGLKIKAPFFEVGPKAIIYGEEMLKLAKVIDQTAMKYDVDVIVTPQYTDIKLLADNTNTLAKRGFRYADRSFKAENSALVGRGGVRRRGSY